LRHRDSVAHRHDFTRDLVSEREWPLHRKEPGGDVQVQVAAGHGERTDQSLLIAFEARCLDVPPLQLAGLNKRELPHRRHEIAPLLAALPDRGVVEYMMLHSCPSMGLRWLLSAAVPVGVVLRRIFTRQSHAARPFDASR
jgi:hypothetical protein